MPNQPLIKTLRDGARRLLEQLRNCETIDLGEYSDLMAAIGVANGLLWQTDRDEVIS